MGAYVMLLDMPYGLKGCTCENCDGGYTILINSKLSYEQQKKTLLHEVSHILGNDFEKHDVDIIEGDLQWQGIKNVRMEGTNLIFL